MQKRVLSLGLVVLAMLTASRPSFAQAYGAAYQSFINTLITNKIMESSMKNYPKDNSRKSGSSSASSSSRPPEVPDYRKYPVVQFKPSGTRLILQEYLDGVTGTSQDKAEAKELVLGILSGYETAAAAKGLPYDLALATVSYIGLNRHVYSGAEEPIIPFEQNVGLRDVLAENMTKSGVLANYSDQKKQEIYEFLVIFGGLTYQLCDKARKEKNAEELKNCKLASAQNLKFMGIEP